MRVGWIGTGVMGASMCGHLVAKGFAVTVSTRTRAKAEPLLARGAAWADSPRAVADASDVVFTMLGFPDEVRAVYLGDGGLATAARAGQILVDMSTSEPALARQNARGAPPPSMRRYRAATSARARGACRSWSAATRAPSRRSSRCCRRWARPSCARAAPAPGSTPRW
jgi:3-hydroxyisobutyrate dehydrogenase